MTDPLQPENWPAWATEAVEIAPANPNWDAQAQEEIRQLKRFLEQFNIHQFDIFSGCWIIMNGKRYISGLLF
ncbi:hypothetical protein [Paenibacillus xylanexedens]|uniref:hypothetical protein n=1 Tax=Paenibacillus xylanexedens TaxID=528191 RepID=UPI003B01A0E9